MSEQNEQPKRELTVDDVRHHLGLVVGALKGSKTNIDTVIAESKAGLTAINGIADKLKGMKYEGAHRVGDLLLAGLEKSAAILDLDETVSPRIEQALTDLREAYALTITLVRERDQQVEQASALLESVKSTSAHTLLLLPRPQSELFGEVEEGASDSFPVINSPESVLSRLRFIQDEEGTVVGIAVFSTLDVQPVINYFYYENYLGSCDLARGKKLEIGGPDGMFVYQQTTSLAVSLADTLVTQFGALNAITDTGHRSEKLQASTDELVEIDIDTSETPESNNEEQGESGQAAAEPQDALDEPGSPDGSFDPNDPTTWVDELDELPSTDAPDEAVSADLESPDALAELSAEFPQ
jgi:hypothetical protein